MNILDENIPESQRVLLRTRRIPFREIGKEVGRKGIKDPEIIPLLHDLDRPTFFTQDFDFYKRRLCHEKYCLVYLDLEEEVIAEHIRRLLRYRGLNTKAKRMGKVIRTMPSGLAFWQIHQVNEVHLAWP